jgi:hypothetical protein
VFSCWLEEGGLDRVARARLDIDGDTDDDGVTNGLLANLLKLNQTKFFSASRPLEKER